LKLPVGERGVLRTTVLFSATEQEREQVNYDTDLVEVYRGTNKLAEQKLSVVAAYDGAVGGRFRYTVGGSAMERNVENLYDQTVSGWLLRPFADGRYSITEHLQATLGLAFSSFSYSGNELFEPRAGLRWRMAKGRVVGLSGGVRGQLPYYQQMNMSTYSFFPSSTDVGLMRSEDLVLGYEHPFNERVSLHVEAYHQRLTQIPQLAPQVIIGDPESQGSVNVWDDPLLLPQVSQGSGRNMGVELTVNRSFDRGYFVQVNGSVYDSEYDLGNGGTKDSRWNGNYRANLMGGAEWSKVKEDRVRTWGVSARVAVAGGLRYTPFDVQVRRGFPVYIYGEPWSAQLNDFFRMDVRVYLKRDRKGRTGMWALDLQNLTDRQNESYVYYDQRKGEIVTKYQLGLIPNLSYRIEF
jgi:hypothetical protein